MIGILLSFFEGDAEHKYGARALALSVPLAASLWSLLTSTTFDCDADADGEEDWGNCNHITSEVPRRHGLIGNGPSAPRREVPY